jgi:hypothetical protein
MFALLGKFKVLALAGVAATGIAVSAPAASAHSGFFAPPAVVVYRAPILVAPAPVCQTPAVVVATAPVCVTPVYVPAPIFYHPDHLIHRGYGHYGWHR